MYTFQMVAPNHVLFSAYSFYDTRNKFSSKQKSGSSCVIPVALTDLLFFGGGGVVGLDGLEGRVAEPIINVQLRES